MRKSLFFSIAACSLASAVSAQDVPLVIDPEQGAAIIARVPAGADALKQAAPVRDGSLATQGWHFVEYNGQVTGFVPASVLKDGKVPANTQVRVAPREDAAVLTTYEGETPIDAVADGAWARVSLSGPVTLYFQSEPVAQAGFNDPTVMGTPAAKPKVAATTVPATPVPVQAAPKSEPKTQQQVTASAPAKQVTKPRPAAASARPVERRPAVLPGEVNARTSQPSQKAGAVPLAQLAEGTLKRSRSFLRSSPYPFEVVDASGHRIAYIDISGLARSLEELIGQPVQLYGPLERDADHNVLVIRATRVRAL